MRIVDRYLARELIGPFFVGVFGFLLMQVSAVLMNLLRLVMDRGAGLAQIFQVVAYRLPQFVVFALPVAILFGVSLGVSRMARENEITVMRLAGMSLRRILAPLVIVATAVSVLSFYINETVAPAMNHRAAQAEYQLFFKVKPVAVRADVFFGAGPYKFYIGDMRQVKGPEDPAASTLLLTRVMVYEMRSGAYPVVYTAETAKAAGMRWTLYNGVRRELNARGFTNNEVAFPKFSFDVDRAVGAIWTAARTPDEMTAAQLSRAIIEGQRAGNADVDQWRTDYYLKFALPFSCVVLAIISLPLAVHFGRGGGFTGILIALGLFFLYVQGYLVLKQFGGALLPPVVAAWLPNVAFALVGGFLLWREE